MTVFKYRGFDSSGKVLKNRLAAESDRHAYSFLLSSILQRSVAQRLVRRLSLFCRRASLLSERDRETFLQAGVRPPSEGYTANGCDDCGQIGYRGRMALYEIAVITEEIAALIHQDASEQEIRACCSTESLLTSGLKAVIAGQTSLEEIFRVMSKS